MEKRPLPWHQALAFALLGVRRPDLGRQVAPDVEALLADLRLTYGSEDALLAAVRSASARTPWPCPVPADLSEGLGPAQFWAALHLLRARLGSTRPSAPTASRGLTADERRLVDDAPPHHLG